MSVKFPKKYYLILAILALLTAIAVYWGTSVIVKQDEEARQKRLELTSKEVASGLENAFNRYATLISGLKSYIEVHNEIPSKELAKSLLEQQLKYLNTEPPFSVSYISTDHIFQYDFTMQPTIPVSLEGTSMEKIIGKSGIRRMDTLMQKSNFYASDPTNLLEGRVALPLGFGVLDGSGKSLGYITTVAELGPILNSLYDAFDNEDFALRLESSDGNYFDRTRTYNGQEVFTKEKDPEYFKIFDIPDEKFIDAQFAFYNKNFTVGTAYKNDYQYSPAMFITSLVWYLAILSFMLFLTAQYYIYERKNKKIAAQKMQLSELVATKNRFFSIIAHDLRSPLSSVINFLDVLKDEKFENTQTKEIINSLEDTSRSSITLIDNLLKWSKLQTGKIKYDPIPLDILAITKDQVKVQEKHLQKKGINVRIESSFKSKVTGDKNMIATVIRNLLSNAIKFSNHNDIIVIELNQVDTFFSLSIEDNGVGIPAKHKDKLLKLSEPIVQEGTNNEKGSGLGLILCHHFVKMHGGSLSIESEVDKGTIVSFSLPL